MKKNIVVVGAGMAGLAAARQLHSLGYKVTLVEARDRVGGRCNTDWSLGGGVDLGASIITGLEGNPLTNVCRQLNTKLHSLKFECPLYDFDGKKVEDDFDQRIEKEFNAILDLSNKMKDTLPPSLGDAIAQLIAQRNVSDTEKRILHWHIANLEYACATDLARVSLHHWDQDDKYEWAGDHCLLREGYCSIAKELTRDLDVQYNTPVSHIEKVEAGYKVHTPNTVYNADAVVVTIPLGVLKSKYRYRFIKLSFN
jgi:lysine-specific histone demethylase 1